MAFYLGVDIGGTKCAVILAREEKNGFEIIAREQFATLSCEECIARFFIEIENLFKKHSLSSRDISSIGISCGGPLNSKRGIIMSPPNLIGWDNVEIVKIFTEKYPVPTFIQNDANACALAEWKFGAGKGTQNMVFMTFGTGLGAGLILNGRLYDGANGNAGEVGHIRLEKFGAVGYGKRGSFEGFCSGSGIAQAARVRAMELLQSGKKCGFCESVEKLSEISAKTVAIAADNGDADAIEIYRECGEYLGRGNAILIDILNPEKIVIGSIYERSENLLVDAMNDIIRKEALAQSAEVCKIVPATLGNAIGDYASISVAIEGFSGRL